MSVPLGVYLSEPLCPCEYFRINIRIVSHPLDHRTNLCALILLLSWSLLARLLDKELERDRNTHRRAIDSFASLLARSHNLSINPSITPLHALLSTRLQTMADSTPTTTEAPQQQQPQQQRHQKPKQRSDDIDAGAALVVAALLAQGFPLPDDRSVDVDKCVLCLIARLYLSIYLS